MPQPATKQTPKQASRAEHNGGLRARAHARLDQLVEDAERGDFYGTVAVEVQMEAGRITYVRRKIDGTDR